jgi:hypothetical protein
VEDETTEEGQGIDGLSLKELRSLAESKGLATYGTKPELKTRITEADSYSEEEK